MQERVHKICRTCKGDITGAEAAFYHHQCEACWMKDNPEKGEKSNLQALVLQACIDGLNDIPKEDERIVACAALVNIMLHGGFCSDKQPLVPIPDHKNPTMVRMVKQKHAQSIMQLRNGFGGMQ